MGTRSVPAESPGKVHGNDVVALAGSTSADSAPEKAPGLSRPVLVSA